MSQKKLKPYFIQLGDHARSVVIPEGFIATLPNDLPAGFQCTIFQEGPLPFGNDIPIAEVFKPTSTNVLTRFEPGRGADDLDIV